MEKTSSGLQENIASLLSYLLGWITGLIFFLIEKENKTVRFHALQSMILFGTLQIIYILLGFIPILSVLLMPVLAILSLVLWLVLMIKTYQGKMVKLPVVSDLADKYV